MAADEQQQQTPAERTATTRREFLGGAGRKALYVTPAVLTLAGQQAFASGPACGSTFRHTVGSPCSTDGIGEKECCPTDSNGDPLICHVEDGQTIGTCQSS